MCVCVSVSVSVSVSVCVCECECRELSPVDNCEWMDAPGHVLCILVKNWILVW